MALALRLGWCLTRPATSQAIDVLPDQREYLTLAQNLLHGVGLQFIDQRFDDRVYAFRTPGYPFFLAACGANIHVARAVQAVIDTSVVLAMYLLATTLLRSCIGGLTAALLVAGNPYLIYFSGLLLSETLFTAMLVWSMVLLVRGEIGGSRNDRLIWLVGGALLALSILVRPSAIGLPVVAGLTAMYANYSGARAYSDTEKPSSALGISVRHLLISLAVLSLLTALVLVPWAARNNRVLGHWVWLDTNSGFTLYDGYNPQATGASNQSWIQGDNELHKLSEVARTQYLAKKARSYARGHVGRSLVLAATKLGRTWSAVPLSSDYGQAKYRLVALIYTVPFDVLVLLGLWWGEIPRGAKFFLLTPALYFSIVHALTVGSLRYRIPAEPPMAVVAAAFIVRLKARATV